MFNKLLKRRNKDSDVPSHPSPTASPQTAPHRAVTSASPTHSEVRPAKEHSLRRSSLGSNLEDLHSSPYGGRRITLTSICPSTTSLDTSSHHSVSLTSLTSGSDLGAGTSHDSPAPLDREGILDITKDVQVFLAAISNLKAALSGKHHSLNDEASSDSQNEALLKKKLCDVIKIVKDILAHHKSMKATPVWAAIHNLGVLFADIRNGILIDFDCKLRCQNELDILTDAFTTSVKIYMQVENEPFQVPQPQPTILHRMGRFNSPGSIPGLYKGFSRSNENLIAATVLDGSKQDVSAEFLDDLDQALMSRMHAVDTVMQHCKDRSKYLKTVSSYLTKRASIEADYYRHMNKLAKQTKDTLRDLEQINGTSLPMCDLFLESVEEDVRFARLSTTTFDSQVNNKVTTPLSQQNQSNEKIRKDLRDTWSKQQKKMNEAKALLNGVRQKYMMLGGDIVKTRQYVHDGNKLEKKRKELADLQAKFAETEAQYKKHVENANSCQYHFHTAQKSILCAFRRMIIETDQLVRTCFQGYFNLHYNFFEQFPVERQKLCDETQHFTTGKGFHQFIMAHTPAPAEPRDFFFEEYNLDETPTNSERSLRNANGNISMPAQSELTNGPPVTSSSGVDRVLTISPSPSPSREEKDRKVRPTSPVLKGFKAFQPRRPKSYYENLSGAASESSEGTADSFWLDPSNRLAAQKGNGQLASSASDLRDIPAVPSQDTGNHKANKMSKNAATHTFHKLESPSRCRECDTQVYFGGVECDQCGLTSHQKCLETLSITCGTKLTKMKLTTFGIDFHEHLKMTNRNIPIVMTKCIIEIESRALDVQGIYRISGAKSKLERLCQLFEDVGDRVDLSEQNPHLIASLLKLYLRSMPTPLMTFGLYKTLMEIAKNSLNILPVKETMSTETKKEGLQLLKKLRGALSKLPTENYMTLACLIYHLKKVAAHKEKNLMPESNLSIVFGPNLMKSQDPQSSLGALADMTYQTKIVEVMISHVKEVFNVSEAEVWHHVLKEENEEKYIPTLTGEATVPALLVHSDSEEELEDGSRTPPDRRMSLLEDINAILINIIGDDTSAGDNQQQSPQLVDCPFEGLSQGFQVPTSQDSSFVRGSIRRSNISLQRKLTPVGEEFASSNPTSLSKADDSRLGSESVAMTIEYNESDDSSDGQPAMYESQQSLPFFTRDDSIEEDSLGSTVSLPVALKSSPLQSPLQSPATQQADMEFGSLDRRELLRHGRLKDRSMGKPSKLIHRYSDMTISHRISPPSGKDFKEESSTPDYKETFKQLMSKTGADGKLVPDSPGESEEDSVNTKTPHSPVRDSLLAGSNGEVTPERNLAKRDTSSRVPLRKVVHSYSDFAIRNIPDQDIDDDLPYFRRNDISRIGIRNQSFPPRPRKTSDFGNDWPQVDSKARERERRDSSNEGPATRPTSNARESDHCHDSLERDGVLSGEKAERSASMQSEAKRLLSESCERDSLSDKSIFSVNHVTMSDSGNESAMTTDIRGSSSEGDLLHDEPSAKNSGTISSSLGYPEIELSPDSKQEEAFPPVWSVDADATDDTEVASEMQDTILSSSSIDVLLLGSPTADESTILASPDGPLDGSGSDHEGTDTRSEAVSKDTPEPQQGTGSLAYEKGDLQQSSLQLEATSKDEDMELDSKVICNNEKVLENDSPSNGYSNSSITEAQTSSPNQQAQLPTGHVVHSSEMSVPDPEGPIPNVTEAVPDPEGPIPNVVEAVPDPEGPIPNVTEAVPDPEGPIPNVTEAVPDPEGPIPNVVEAVPDPEDPIPNVVEAVPDPEDPIPNVVEAVPDPEGPIPNVTEAVPDPEDPIPNVVEAVPDPEGPIPNVVEAVPDPEGPIPNVVEAVPDPEGPIPNVTEAVPDPEGPIPNVVEAVPDPEGSIPNVVEAVPDPEGPIPDVMEAVPDPEGPVPDVMEAVPDPEGPIPNVVEAVPDPEGPVPDVMEAVPDPEGAVVNVDLKDSEVSCPNTDLTGSNARDANLVPDLLLTEESCDLKPQIGDDKPTVIDEQELISEAETDKILEDHPSQQNEVNKKWSSSSCSTAPEIDVYTPTRSVSATQLPGSSSTEAPRRTSDGQLTWKLLGTQSTKLQRADLFEDKFEEGSKVSYGTVAPSKKVNLKRSFRAASDGDILSDNSVVEFPSISKKIELWKEKEITAIRRRESSDSMRLKRRKERRNKAQSCHGDLSSSLEEEYSVQGTVNEETATLPTSNSECSDNSDASKEIPLASDNELEKVKRRVKLSLTPESRKETKRRERLWRRSYSQDNLN